MGWCFIYYRYDGLGGVSYNIDMTDGVVNDGWGGASYNTVWGGVSYNNMTDGVVLHIISE